MFRLFLLLLVSVSTSLGADYINSATAPLSVTQDTTVSVEVSYQASTYRDIVVVFQINSSPWTTFGYNRITVSAGSSTLNIPIAIDANTPIASGIYKFVFFIAPTSGGWLDRLDTKTPENSVSCIQAPGGVSDYDSFSIMLDGAEAELLLKDKIDPIEIIEFSSDLAIWTPVARNYGDQWETVFPHAYDLSAVAGSTDQAMVMAMGEKGFYRKRSTSTINASSNRELASRFLMQATFGPSRAEIDGFPNINSNTFGSPGDDSFVDWIDAQIAISPFYHRAHWRERSDQDYQDLSNQTTLVLQSGGTGTFMVGDMVSLTEGNTVLTGEISSINQNNNVQESISVTNVTKRLLEPFTVSFGAISLYNSNNTSTYRDLLYDNTDSPTSWSIEMGALSSPATVTVEFLPTPTQYSSGTFSEFNSIQTNIWDDSVDVLGQTATYKQVAQVSGVQSGATISGSIDTTRSDNYVDVAAMRVTIDYNPGQLRYNIDFGTSVFDANDNDAASGFGTNYYSWNTNSTTASFNPFSAADPTFGDYASITTIVTVGGNGGNVSFYRLRAENLGFLN